MIRNTITEVTQCQYNLHVAYEQSKYGCSKTEAIKVMDKLYIVTNRCEEKWKLYDELVKLGKIISELNKRNY